MEETSPLSPLSPSSSTPRHLQGLKCFVAHTHTSLACWESCSQIHTAVQARHTAHCHATKSLKTKKAKAQPCHTRHTHTNTRHTHTHTTVHVLLLLLGMFSAAYVESTKMRQPRHHNSNWQGNQQAKQTHQLQEWARNACPLPCRLFLSPIVLKCRLSPYHAKSIAVPPSCRLVACSSRLPITLTPVLSCRLPCLFLPSKCHLDAKWCMHGDRGAKEYVVQAMSTMCLASCHAFPKGGTGLENAHPNVCAKVQEECQPGHGSFFFSRSSSPCPSRGRDRDERRKEEKVRQCEV